jgi:hypothetical protein
MPPTPRRRRPGWGLRGCCADWWCRTQPEAVGEVSGLGERCEDLDVQQLVRQLAVETLDVGVLPGAAGLDEDRSGVDAAEPSAHFGSDKLRAVVRADVPWDAALDDDLGELIDDVARRDVPFPNAPAASDPGTPIGFVRIRRASIPPRFFDADCPKSRCGVATAMPRTRSGRPSPTPPPRSRVRLPQGICPEGRVESEPAVTPLDSLS